MIEVLASGLFGAVLVFLAGLWALARQRAARIKGNWSVLFVEVRECGRTAKVYLEDDVMAPLYRLPTISFETCYPALLTDAGLDEDKADILLKFFTEVQTVNRGLDLTDDLSRTKGHPLMKGAYERNCLKAKRVKSPDSELYKDAIELCAQHKK